MGIFDIRAHIISGTQMGTIILTTYHVLSEKPACRRSLFLSMTMLAVRHTVLNQCTYVVIDEASAFPGRVFVSCRPKP